MLGNNIASRQNFFTCVSITRKDSCVSLQSSAMAWKTSSVVLGLLSTLVSAQSGMGYELLSIVIHC